MSARAGLVAAIAAIGGASSCTASEAPAPLAATEVRPSFYEDVAPIFAARCLSCHVTGGISARIALDNYAGAAAAQSHLSHAVSSREMPPWGVDSSGRCGDFAAPRALSSDEIDTIVRWVDRGAPAGDPARRRTVPLGGDVAPTRAIPANAPRHALFGDVRPKLAEGATRCAIVDPRTTDAMLLTAIDFEPARPFGVRQVTVHALDTDADEAAARALDAADPESGWPCVGGIGVPTARFVGGTTWTSPTMRFPNDTGVRLEPGRKLVVQVDYNLAVGLDADGGVLVGTELAPLGAAPEGAWRSVRAKTIDLPPELRDATARGQAVLPTAMDVLAVYPQMRQLGTSLVLTADRPRGAGRACMLTQEHWDMHMLRDARAYATPVHLDAQSLLEVECRYTTLTRTANVHGGEGPDDEECGVLLYGLR